MAKNNVQNNTDDNDDDLEILKDAKLQELCTRMANLAKRFENANSNHVDEVKQNLSKILAKPVWK